MATIILLLKLLASIVLLLVVLGVVRTWQMERSANQARFIAGTVPDPAPNGFYHGKIGWKTTWLGKKFDASNSIGINVFDNGNGVQGESSSFVTSYTKGTQDKELDVLAINYNIQQNPFWLRIILDEVVQIDRDHYLGKLQLRIIPGFPFTLAFFELRK